MKRYFPTGTRNYGRPLKRLLDTWDRNGSISGPTPWHDNDDDDLTQPEGPLSILQPATCPCRQPPESRTRFIIAFL
jgi:hypothetical protein